MFVNMTPHDVVIYGHGLENPPSHTLPSAGSLRLEEDARFWATALGVSIYGVTLGAAELPPAVAGTFYIVSMPLAQAFAGVRDDLVYPFGQVRKTPDGTLATGPNARGQIVGCTSLAVIL